METNTAQLSSFVIFNAKSYETSGQFISGIHFFFRGKYQAYIIPYISMGIKRWVNCKEGDGESLSFVSHKQIPILNTFVTNYTWKCMSS